MTAEAEDAIMPINEVMPKPMGIVNSCDHNASFGFLANLEKSGSFMMRAAKFPRQLMIAFTIAQARVLPWTVAG
jgi:hypothetical protein